MAESYDLIFNSRHPDLKKKDDTWKLIYNSYVGGTVFKDANYLIKYPKESNFSFGVRKSRAVYFNQVSPIVDMVSGLILINQPARKIPKELNYLLEDISKEKKIDEFMRIVAAHAFMYTCAVLVDVPNFDREAIKTEKDRRDNKIRPYASLYLPFKIRDFNINQEDGSLDWVILDDSYRDHSNPLEAPKDVTKYTLWTRTGFRSFIMKKSGNQTAIEADEAETPHNVGYVPVKFVSWRDDNNDFISESVCEDIAMVSRMIYNNLSYMDEMLASGTFKMLAYPSRDGDIPENLKSGGVGNLGIIPYDIESSNAPEFIGASLADIDPFVKAIEFYMAEVLKKVGMSTDETKEFVKSGAAKKVDFQKMKSLLLSGGTVIGKLEEWIFKTSAAWLNINNPEIKVQYTSAYNDEDLRTEITMLTELLVHPIKKLRVNVLNLIVKKLLANNLQPEVLDEIYKDVEDNISVVSLLSNSRINPKQEAQNIKDQNNKTEQGDDVDEDQKT
jgi:hypothetical protein